MISLPTGLFGEIQSASGRGCLHRGLGNQNLENPQSYKIAVDKSAQPLFQREVLSFLSWAGKKKNVAFSLGGRLHLPQLFAAYISLKWMSITKTVNTSSQDVQKYRDSCKIFSKNYHSFSSTRPKKGSNILLRD